MSPCIPDYLSSWVGSKPPGNAKIQFKVISRLHRMNCHYIISIIPLPIYLLPRKNLHWRKNQLLFFFSSPSSQMPTDSFEKKNSLRQTDSLNHFQLNSNSKTEFLHSRLEKKDTQNQKYISNTKQSTCSETNIYTKINPKANENVNDQSR